jgi:hypothetical protein
MTKFDEERARHTEPVEMTIRSKCPSKWRFVDGETGEVWKWDEERGVMTFAGFAAQGQSMSVVTAIGLNEAKLDA